GREFDSPDIPGLGAYLLSTVHMAVEHFLVAMVLGGVFERHPELRFGIIECGAQWLAPAVQRMDLFATHFQASKGLPLRPSEQFGRNVRVTPFSFEPVEQYFETYPALASVYCYSTDYPHVEGGKQSKREFFERLAPLGDEIVDKFFVSNGAFLLPA